MVSHEGVGQGADAAGARGQGDSPLGVGWLGAVVAAVLLLLLTFGLSFDRSVLNLTSDVLLFLLAVVAVALIGGIWPALGAAVVGSLLLNYYFVPPLHTFSISEGNNILALLVFVAVGAMVSRVVDLAARRTAQAARAAAEAETLFTLAGSVLRGQAALPALLEQVRTTFGMTSATLLETRAGGGRREPGRTSADDLVEPVDRHGWHIVGVRRCRPVLSSGGG